MSAKRVWAVLVTAEPVPIVHHQSVGGDEELCLEIW